MKCEQFCDAIIPSHFIPRSLADTLTDMPRFHVARLAKVYNREAPAHSAGFDNSPPLSYTNPPPFSTRHGNTRHDMVERLSRAHKKTPKEKEEELDKRTKQWDNDFQIVASLSTMTEREKLASGRARKSVIQKRTHAHTRRYTPHSGAHHHSTLRAACANVCANFHLKGQLQSQNARSYQQEDGHW